MLKKYINPDIYFKNFDYYFFSLSVYADELIIKFCKIRVKISLNSFSSDEPSFVPGYFVLDVFFKVQILTNYSFVEFSYVQYLINNKGANTKELCMCVQKYLRNGIQISEIFLHWYVLDSLPLPPHPKKMANEQKYLLYLSDAVTYQGWQLL